MRWVAILAAVALVLAGSAFASAAMLGVSSDGMTVFANTRTSPTMNAAPSSSTVVVGGSASGSASLIGATSNAGGTMTYTVYGDDHCGTVYASAGVKTVINGTAPDSDDVTFTAAGSYYWHMSYSGDGNNQPVESDCDAEPITVTKATPSLTTAAAGPVTIGESITDAATLSGGYGTLTGTITFNVYAPDDPACASPLAPAPAGVTASGAGLYTSGAFTTAAVGDYRWVASYSGDANNNAVSGSCGDVGETSTVNKAQPLMSTSAADGSVGVQPIADTATLSGYGTLTGTITFNVYAPDDPTCALPLSPAPAGATVNGAGSYFSGGFAPAVAGTYRWIASYSGDANNNPVTGNCNDAGEFSTVTAP